MKLKTKYTHNYKQIKPAPRTANNMRGNNMEIKVSEVIQQLQELMEKNGDCNFNVYGSFTKQNLGSIDIFYDDAEKDICIGVYA